jgi:hypothetical protein
MTTFRFNSEGELTEVTGPPPSWINGPVSFLPPAVSLDLLDTLRKEMELRIAPRQDVFLNPIHMPGVRTALGCDQQRAQAVLGMQTMMNGIHNSLLDSMRIVMDEYAPTSVRRQVRFPRSKKRRIRKKWAKDPRNWREFDCMWLVDTARLRNSKVITFGKGAVHDQRADRRRHR